MGVGTERETLNINVSILSYHFTLPLLRGWVRMRRCQAKSNKQRMQRLQCRPCNRRPRSKRERVVKVIYKYKTKLTTTKDSMRNKWFCFGDLLPHQQVNAQGRYSRARKVRPRVNARVNLGWCTLLQGSRGPSTDIPIGPSEGGGDS